MRHAQPDLESQRSALCVSVGSPDCFGYREL